MQLLSRMQGHARLLSAYFRAGQLRSWTGEIEILRVRKSMRSDSQFTVTPEGSKRIVEVLVSHWNDRPWRYELPDEKVVKVARRLLDVYQSAWRPELFNPPLAIADRSLLQDCWSRRLFARTTSLETRSIISDEGRVVTSTARTLPRPLVLMHEKTTAYNETTLNFVSQNTLSGGIAIPEEPNPSVMQSRLQYLPKMAPASRLTPLMWH